MVFRILRQVQSIVRRGLHAVSTAISRATRPNTHGPALSTVAGLTRGKPQPTGSSGGLALRSTSTWNELILGEDRPEIGFQLHLGVVL